MTSTYNAGTGVWTASGATANVNALLAGVAFSPAANFNGNFTVATNVSDGVAPAITGTKAFTGVAVNDAPTATNLSVAETYTEDTALNLTDIVITDIDSSNVTATLTLSNTAAGSLSTATSGAVTSTYNAGTGVWTASGATANVNALLAGVAFSPAANFNGNFTVATNVSDGVAPAITGTKAFTGVAVNDAPVIDLNGGAAGTSTTLAYTVGTGAATIAPSGLVSDVDSPDFNGGSLTVSFNSNGTSADQLTIFNQGTGAGQIGVSGSSLTYGGVTFATFTGGTNGTSLVVTFTTAGATQAAAQALIEDIRYANSSSGAATKTLTFTLNDGDGTANGGANTGTATATINLIAGDTTPPTVAISGPDLPNGPGSKTTVTFTFSEAVTGFTLADVVISSGGNGTWGTLTQVNSTTYTAELTRTANGNVIVSVTAGSYADLAGNLGAGKSESFPAGVAGEPINLGLSSSLATDGVATVAISNLPASWSIAGAQEIAPGVWTVNSSLLGSLAVVTATDFVGALTLTVKIDEVGSDGNQASMIITSNVEAFAQGSPIFAWSGDDHLTGSAGDDLFVVADPIGADRFYSFDTSHDRVDLIGFAGFSSWTDVQAHLATVNGEAVLTLGDGMSITFVGVGSDLLSADNFLFNEEPVTHNGAAMTIGNGAMLPLSGIIDNTGSIELQAAGSETLLQLIRDGITLQGGGQVTLSDDANNVIAGTSSSIVLTNVDNTISGAGQLGSGQLTLINQANGTIIATGTHELVIDTGSSTFSNAGLVQATGTGGLVVTGSMDNAGTLWANGSTITIHGAVTGTGQSIISGSGVIEFGAASTAHTTFDATASGTLVLADAFDFSGTVAGFDGNDALVLGDVAGGTSTTLDYVADIDGHGGVLNVSDGVHGAAIAFNGDYDAAGFTFETDSAGHAVIRYVPIHADAALV